MIGIAEEIITAYVLEDLYQSMLKNPDVQKYCNLELNVLQDCENIIG